MKKVIVVLFSVVLFSLSLSSSATAAPYQCSSQSFGVDTPVMYGGKFDYCYNGKTTYFTKITPIAKGTSKCPVQKKTIDKRTYSNGQSLANVKITFGCKINPNGTTSKGKTTETVTLTVAPSGRIATGIHS